MFNFYLHLIAIALSFKKEKRRRRLMIFYPGWYLKGQINQKVDIFSFVALPSPNTKKKHPKWDLGKDFFSQAFIEI